MKTRRESVVVRSLGDELAGTLFLPETEEPSPALILCHGAGDFKENYFEMSERLAERGIVALALDMHGHGASGGGRFHVDMRQWAADVRAAIDFLQSRAEVNGSQIAGFGLSSGGTAILEAALVDKRLKALIPLDATVRNSLPLPMSCFVKFLLLLGRIKVALTQKPLRVPFGKIGPLPMLASGPAVNREIYDYPRSWEGFNSFPLPGGEHAFFVDTIKHVSRITAPTLVLWGEEDKVDSPETARLLYSALTCKKELRIIKGNGHVGHRDRHKDKVFALTADWILQNVGESPLTECVVADSEHGFQNHRGGSLRKLGLQGKWALLSPFLKQYGRSALAYATLQDGMEYFLDETGYIAYTSVRHPVFARKPKRITLSDPICAPADLPKLIRNFLSEDPRAVFAVISEECVEVLRPMGFKANCIGCEPELPLQTYNTQGNWKELDLIKRARNEVKREGIAIREETAASLNAQELAALSARWVSTKLISDREIWIYARRPVFGHEEDVRKFVAYDKEGRGIGFVFYDPMYRAGEVFGYSANIVRCDELRYGRLGTAVHMVATEKFKAEGKEALNLLLSPCTKMELGKYNDDWVSTFFFKLCERYGNNIYNFRGLSFHKSKYRGVDKPIYYASNSFMPSNDIYLAYRACDVAGSYFSTLLQLLRGMVSAKNKDNADSTSR